MLIREVLLRDGLQAEPRQVDTATKIDLIKRISGAGFKAVEVTSFAHPEKVPQMADAEAVWNGFARLPGVDYSALALNVRSVERGLEVGVDHFSVVVAASDGYNQRNVGVPIEVTLRHISEITRLAVGCVLDGTVATAWGSPYDGWTEPERVYGLVSSLGEMGLTAITLGDTTGMASPRAVADLVAGVWDRFPDVRLNLHLHNSRGTAMANALAGYEGGVREFDTAIGGLGGSPGVATAEGNLCTEDFVHMLGLMGVETGIDLGAVLRIAGELPSLVGHEVPGKVSSVGSLLEEA